MAELIFLPFDSEKDACAVEECMGFINVGTAHGKVPGINNVLYRKGPFTRRATPGMVSRLVHLHGLGPVAGGNGFDLASKISNKIAAGTPRREGKCMPLRVEMHYGHRDA